MPGRFSLSLPLAGDGFFGSAPLLTLFLLLAGSVGLFLGLPNPVLHLPLAVLAYPGCLYLLAQLASSRKQAAIHGWLLGFCGNGAGLYWILYPMHDVAGIPLLVAVPCAMLLYAALACYSALFAFGVNRLSSLPVFAHTGSAGCGRALAPPLLAGLLFAGFEVWCGFLFTGFPWLALNGAFGLTPVWMQAASLIGGCGLSALYAAAACCIASMMLAPTARQRLAAGLTALALLAALPGYGLLRLAAQPPVPAGPPFSLLIVQGNIDQNQKWVPAFQHHTLKHYIALSEQGLAEQMRQDPPQAPLLVLWPETAMPFAFQSHPDYAEQLYSFAARHRINLLFGALGVEHGTPPRLFNRLFLLSPKGTFLGYYDKRHLVPFGEYTPFAADLPFLRDLLQGMDFFPGKTAGPLFPERPGQNARPPLLGPLICYEAIFSSLAHERVAHGATVLVNVSNDGWFRQSSAPLQHLSHVAMRAVEQSRPVLRATNTGVSAVIDARGRITASTAELFVDGALAGKAEPCAETTLFHRLHPVPELLLAALALFSLFGYSFRNQRNRIR